MQQTLDAKLLEKNEKNCSQIEVEDETFNEVFFHAFRQIATFT